MDQELQEALRSNDYQRLYTLYTRMGELEKSQQLFLDHKIEVPCTIQYRWCCYYIIEIDTEEYSDGYGSVSKHSLEELIEAFIAKNIGVGQISAIDRIPIARILGIELDLTSSRTEEGRDANVLLNFETYYLNGDDALLDIRNKIRTHPNYLKTASPRQRELATIFEQRMMDRACVEQRRIDEEEAEQQRARFLEHEFEMHSRVLRETTWRLWLEYHALPRAKFAEIATQHPESRWLL